MNLLVITNNPDRPSFRQRIEMYSGVLEEKGIKCEVAKLPKGTVERVRLFRQASGFDGVFLQKKRLNFHDAFWLRGFSRKIIYDFDDAVMYNPNRPESNNALRLRLFGRTVKAADLVIAGNDYLAEEARRFNCNVEVLPTGLDTKKYDIKSRAVDDGVVRLVWIGSKSTLNYLEGIRAGFEEVGRRFKNVRLRIICDDFFELKNIAVEKCIWSVDSQCKDLAGSDIGLAVLPDNRFTRGKCGFKILQYQAAGLPVITSPVGVNAEFVKDRINGVVAFDIDGWIKGICELVEDAGLRKQMGENAKVEVGKFDCSLIGQRLAELIKGILETK